MVYNERSMFHLKHHIIRLINIYKKSRNQFKEYRNLLATQLLTLIIGLFLPNEYKKYVILLFYQFKISHRLLSVIRALLQIFKLQ